MHSRSFPAKASPRLLGASVSWLLAGAVLLLTTALPARTDLLGWTPAFWLLGAPLIMLLAQRRRLRLAPGSRHRRAAPALPWHGVHLRR
ncbi:MAG: hypothetical protein KGJ96_11015 [Xanthomonadaceae bacterium]|nr:hypothetical protein [Xanthomonadaceae bacterium]